MTHTVLQAESSLLPPSAPPTNHGHTTAAWFTMTTIMVGAVIAGVALCLSLVWLAWVGGAIAVVGTIIGKVLSVAGYGQPSESAQGPAKA